MSWAYGSWPRGCGFKPRHRIVDGWKWFASYYIKEKLKIKVAKWGTPKNITLDLESWSWHSMMSVLTVWFKKLLSMRWVILITVGLDMLLIMSLDLDICLSWQSNQKGALNVSRNLGLDWSWHALNWESRSQHGFDVTLDIQVKKLLSMCWVILITVGLDMLSIMSLNLSQSQQSS
jgi:hypothetical protein